MLRLLGSATVVVVVVLVCFSAVATAADAPATSALQITCWPGHRVYLDGQLKGLTTVDQDGLFLDSVDPGDHVVRVEKLGFEPATFEVSLRAGELAEVRVGELVPLGQEPWRELRGMPTPPEPALPASHVKPAGAAGGLVAVSEAAPTDAVPETAPGPTSEAGVPAKPAPRDTIAPETAVDAPIAAEPAAPEDVRPSPETVDVTAAPVVLASDASPMPTGPVPDGSEHAREASGFELERPAPTVSDVLFAYRARGPGLTAGGTVTIHRERGGPRAPVMVFWCVGESECRDQSKPSFAPGSYRFRVNCRRGAAPSASDADVFLDVEAETGGSYLVDAVFDDGCRASVVDLSAKEAGPKAR